MKAFAGPISKSELLEEIKWHEEQDAFVKLSVGNGDGDSFKGCAVACSVNSLNRRLEMQLVPYTHSAFPEYFGIPESLAWLLEYFFERLPSGVSATVTRQFFEAIPEGADLGLVSNKFQVWLLREVRQYAFDDGKSAIDQAISLHERVIAGETVTDDEWSAAESAAESAARSARSAAESARSAQSAADAAWSAARSAQSAADAAAESARSAAWAADAAWSAARSAQSAADAAESAWSAAIEKQSEVLLSLLRAEEVTA